jgi:inosine-uridine nucleoside N-ribohydrolase
VYVGCHEGLVHRHVYTDRFHGVDGFNMVEFPELPEKEQEESGSPIVEDEPSPQAMVRLVKKYPG